MYRVIWQYGPRRMGPLESATLPSTPPSAPESVFSGLPLDGAPAAVFTRHAVALRRQLLALPPEFRAQPENDLAAYQHAFVLTREAADTLIARLRNDRDIAYAELQGRPEPAFILDESRRSRVRQHTDTPLGPEQLRETPDYAPRQRYLDRAPAGIGVRALGTNASARGAGVRIADIETGWNFQHEDLTQFQVGVAHGNSGAYRDHGTAVLGIIGGDANGSGVEGAVPAAICSTYAAEYDGQRRKWNAADAILVAADRLSRGDVILLEMHAPGPNAAERYPQHGFIPIEYWQAEFAAIRHAIARGIHVVEAAGNGSENLDDDAYGERFSRANRDSGAILVGAGASAAQPDARSRLWWSNYGSRIDLQGWGEDIVTTGGREDPNYYDLRDDPDGDRCYTQSFGGTSGASPIVVGAVAAIESVLRPTKRPQLGPRAMRELLDSTGTPQVDGPDGPASQRVGPLPDVPAALRQLGILA